MLQSVPVAPCPVTASPSTACAFFTPSSSGHQHHQDVLFPSIKPQFFSFLPWYINVFLQRKPKSGHKTSNAQVHIGTTLGFTSASMSSSSCAALTHHGCQELLQKSRTQRTFSAGSPLTDFKHSLFSHLAIFKGSLIHGHSFRACLHFWKAS